MNLSLRCQNKGEIIDYYCKINYESHMVQGVEF